MPVHDKIDKYEHLGPSEPALIQGRLCDVDPKLGTAKIDAYFDERVPLRFDSSLELDMLRLETKFVKVWGHGWIDDDADRWIVIEVEKIARPETRTIDEIINDPNPKPFDPDNVVTAREPFDVDKFLQGIYEARRAGWKEYRG
jgi:hypothetical protein